MKNYIAFLEKTLKRFKKTFEFAPVGSALTSIDQKYIVVNKKFADLIETTPEELIGVNIQEITHKDDQNIHNIKLNELLSGDVDLVKYEKRFISRNSNIIWADMSVSLVRDEEGNPVYFIPIIMDITERKRLEQVNEFRIYLTEYSYKATLDEIIQITLDKAEEFTQSNIGFFHFVDDDQENLHLQMWSTNTFQNMCKANAKDQHYSISSAGVWVDAFYQKTPVIHNDYKSLEFKKGLPVGHAEVIRELVVPVLRGDKVIAILGVGNKETLYTQKDVESVSTLASFVMNIVERKRAEISLKQSEARLKELNSTKDKFFSIIAHDLKNPLGNYMQITKMMYENYHEFSEDERLEFLQLMKESAGNIYELLDNLLSWSQSQRNKISFNPEELDFHQIVDSILSLHSISAETKNIKLINKVQEKSLIYGDNNLITTIIRNLLTNAIKFTNTNGVIEIGLLNQDTQFHTFYIKDNGVGIPDKYIDKLFKIEDNHTTRGTNDEKGTGLGLILCKEFAEKHNGKIWVESKIGVGSTFFVELPKI